MRRGCVLARRRPRAADYPCAVGTALLQRLSNLLMAEGGGLERRARRVSVRILAVLRLLTVPVTFVLGISSDATHWPWLAVAAGFVGLEVVVSSRWLDRQEQPGRSPVSSIPFLLDAVALGVVFALTGQEHSNALLIVLMLPTATAFVLTQRDVLILGIGAFAVYAVVTGPGRHLAVFALEWAWAVAIAFAIAQQLEAVLRRFRRLDRMIAALSASPEETVRDRVGVELRQVALSPTQVIAGRVREPGADLHQLVAQLDGVIARTRSVVSELHVLSGGAGGVEAALRRLAERRAPEARVTVEIDPRAEARAAVGRGLDTVIVAMVRDALGVVAARPVSEIDLRVSGDDTLVLEVRAAGIAKPLAHGTVTARERALVGRVAAVDGRLDRIGGPRAGVRITLRSVDTAPRVDPQIPGRAIRGAAVVLSVTRVLAGVVALPVGLIVGGYHPTFIPAAIVLVLTGPLVAWVLISVKPKLPGLATLFGLDLAAFMLTFAAAGADAQQATLSMTVALPVSYGLMLGPQAVLIPGALAGAAVSTIAPTGAAFVIAYAWGGAVSVALSWGGLLLADTLGRATGRRTVLLVNALAAEDRERRRLAGQLHDDVLQLLLTARQDLDEAAHGHDGAARAEAVRHLDAATATLIRAVSELDVEEDARRIVGGLQAALAASAAEVERRGTARILVEVAPEASGIADSLVVRVARELLLNVAKHAEADSVRVRVSREPRAIVLDVIDDGVGFDRARVDDAVDRGHIGLAAARERIEASGGTLDLLDVAGGGAHARVTLPA